MSEGEGRPGVRLAGDASTRTFYRVARQPEGTAIEVVYGHPLDESGRAFVATAEYLSEIGVPAPAILEVDEPGGRIVVEDLGDVMLEAVALADEGERLYDEAVRQILVLQEAGRAGPAPGVPAYGIRHDAEKLAFELDFFRRHFLEGWREIEMGAAESLALDRALARLVEEVAGHPLALCHRDYHSRNLMVRDGGLVWIDFQDARLGPRTYDLASLLWDAYVTLPAGRRRRLLRLFAGEQTEAVEAELHPVGLQRTLKALGTFGYQVGGLGRDRYRDAARRALGHLAELLPARPDDSELYGLLSAKIPELEVPPASR